VCAASFSLRPLLPVDETRYLSVAWEMWLGGNWLVPHLNGVP
jgi:4-amino-4-deoxy-L-arabinose transferase-like glycosyltransferase